ncbi:MAG: hypothetical protein A2289_14250 [Deltaproteobacteria bacterium RIFOXYA12_FULL_58_15]|nr:MAG: hypothetical protein A2289_14250 [Deltaproteobacteria bacterium RIFOXYA12_FULL_58_15]
MKTLIKFAIVTTCAGLVAACVEHRPIRNGLRDESIYLTKTDMTQANPKTDDAADDGWLLKVTTVKASSPNVIGDYIFPGLESYIRYVKFRFRENALQLIDSRKLQNDDPSDYNDDLATSTERVMVEFKGEHVDIKLRESLDGERTNWLEENTEEPWQQRQKFKVDFEQTSYDPVHFLWWGYVDYVADCAQMTGMSLVPDSFEWDEDDQYMSFVVEANYRLKSITGYGGCWDLITLATDTTTGTIQYRFSFYRPGPSNYEPQVIDEKDLVNKKYGSFQSLTYGGEGIWRDETTGLLGARSLLYRFNPKRTEPVVYYFAEGFPNDYKLMFGQIAEETNAVLAEAGASLRFTFANKPPEINFGDIRHSFMVWHQDIDTTKGLLGYGPPGADPRTGEIISAVTNLYNVGMDYYRFMIQDYLAEFGGATKESLGETADTPWEDITCSGNVTVAPANHTGRLTAPIFDEMRRVLDLPETPSNPPEDDFIPTPQQPIEEFEGNWHRVQDEYRYAVYWWNAYTMKGGESHPMANFRETLAVEREFRDAMDAIELGENPFGPANPASTEGIEAQLEFRDNFRRWRKNHERFEIDRNMMWSGRNVYEFNEGNALDVISSGARRCVNGHYESDEKYIDRVIKDVVAHTAVHEFGHNLSLRHNFYGSVDVKHMQPGEITASVMDYVSPIEDTGTPQGWGDYDEAALKWIYGTDAVRTEVMTDDFLYCTDEHRHFSPMCQAFDLGVTPAQVVLNAIENYDWGYKFRNRRAFRTFWDTYSYSSRVYNAIFPLARMYFFAAYDLGSVADLMKKLDMVDPDAEVLTPQQYNAIAADMQNDAGAAIDMTMAFYDAIINQSAAYRNYQTEFDPYYGDVLRLGIISDKLYATYAFMDFQEVWNYDPNIYDYLAMYDYTFTSRNAMTAQRVLDDMLGSSYDTFPWFKYTALLLFASATNSNLIMNVELKERIAIERYDNLMELEEVYPGVLVEALGPDNPAQLFTFEGQTYAYTYLADRNWHLVANQSRSPVSYQYLRDYNNSLNASASETLDNYGLKVLLAYHEYFNNFQGF